MVRRPSVWRRSDKMLHRSGKVYATPKPKVPRADRRGVKMSRRNSLATDDPPGTVGSHRRKFGCNLEPTAPKFHRTAGRAALPDEHSAHHPRSHRGDAAAMALVAFRRGREEGADLGRHPAALRTRTSVLDARSTSGRPSARRAARALSLAKGPMDRQRQRPAGNRPPRLRNTTAIRRATARVADRIDEPAVATAA